MGEVSQPEVRPARSLFASEECDYYTSLVARELQVQKGMKASLHIDNHGVESINVWGICHYPDQNGVDRTWHVSFWLRKRPSGEWKIGWYEATRGENCRRAFTAARVYGLPYKPTEAVRLRMFLDCEYAVSMLSKVEILSKEIEIGVLAQPEPRVRTLHFSGVHSMTNETTGTTAKAEVKKCQVVPLPTSKAGRHGEAHCPRIAADNEFSICGGHFAFYKKGSELRLVDGRVLNPKPVQAAPVPEPPKAPEAPKPKAAKKVKKPAPAEPLMTITTHPAVGALAARSTPSGN